MKNFSQERIGEISVFSSAILWSLFPVLTVLSLTSLGPTTSLAWTTLLSLFFFAGMAVFRNSWANVFRRKLLLPLLGLTLTNGVLFYVFYFTGLQYTSSGNASIIATLEILFSFLYFNIWRKEFIDAKHISGAVLMLVSAVIILSPNFHHFQPGDFFILAAVFIAPIGNFLQKKVRGDISSEQILLFRTVFATPVLFLLAYALGEHVILPPKEVWLTVLISGIVLFGIAKMFWIESIHRIGVTKAISLSSISPVFTLTFAFLLLRDIPTVIQLAAVPFAIIGVYLLTRPANKIPVDV